MSWVVWMVWRCGVSADDKAAPDFARGAPERVGAVPAAALEAAPGLRLEQPPAHRARANTSAAQMHDRACTGWRLPPGKVTSGGIAGFPDAVPRPWPDSGRWRYALAGMWYRRRGARARGGECNLAIGVAQVRHVARLARLSVAEDELEGYARDLDRILTHVQRLGELPTDGIPPTSSALELGGVVRADESRPGLAPEAALRNAPESHAQMFVVPQVVEG